MNFVPNCYSVLVPDTAIL